MDEGRRAEVSVLRGEKKIIGFPEFPLLAVVTAKGATGVCVP